MNKKLLSESTSVPVATGTEGRWRAVFITPGRGTSGEWTEEVLERDGAHALKKGARCFVTHNRLEGGEPDPFAMWATLAEDAVYEEGVGLVGEVQVLKSWREKVEEVAPHTALSVYLWTDVDEYGTVTRIYEDIENGVDLVVHPGREGSELVQKMYESAKRNSEKTPTADSATGTQEEKVGGATVTKEILEAIAAVESKLNAKIDTILATKTQEAQAEVDADAIAEAKKEAVEQFDAQADLIAKADLLPAQESALKSALKRGEDITDRLEEAKTVAKEAAELGASRGDRVAETGRFVAGKVTESAEPKTPVNLKGLFS